MPKIIKQPKDTGALPRLHDRESAMRQLRMGANKFNEIQSEIDCVVIGKRKFWTDEQLAAYLRRQTRKGKPAPQRAESRASA